MRAAGSSLLEQLDASRECLLPVERHRWVLDDGDSVRAWSFRHAAMLHGCDARWLVPGIVAGARDHPGQLLAEPLAEPA